MGKVEGESQTIHDMIIMLWRDCDAFILFPMDLKITTYYWPIKYLNLREQLKVLKPFQTQTCHQFIGKITSYHFQTAWVIERIFMDATVLDSYLMLCFDFYCSKELERFYFDFQACDHFLGCKFKCQSTVSLVIIHGQIIFIFIQTR